MESVAKLSQEDAKQQLKEELESEFSEYFAKQIKLKEQGMEEEYEEKAKNIMAEAMQRYAAEVASESTSTIVQLPSDDIKGKIIGKEGRNITAFEQATGVDIIIDDTPGAIIISGYDLARRYVAKLSMEKLIKDGRIQPARIEEVVSKAKEEVAATINTAGEQAAYEAGVPGLRAELLRLLGRLKYRTSYGQNVLRHSIEVAHMAGMIATELGANAATAKKAGLLHDIGKAVDHEVEGTHAAIGADLVKQWDKSSDVVQGIGEHHFETGSTSLWGYIVSAADAISSARPGARRESVENYMKRLEALEKVARDFDGVEKCFAIQAGREVRVMVQPDTIDDVLASKMARDI